ncbi:hypothetical protein E2C01_062502 [Portunus trituberculatus]|uniref:Uncharacterized protein n=1 Tax=Portunus trituberculatus TaxID=210409 RepID=A0A5B7HDU9_PORTR|nr:hypothetical protein [Portunus trituberculatus]
MYAERRPPFLLITPHCHWIRKVGRSNNSAFPVAIFVSFCPTPPFVNRGYCLETTRLLSTTTVGLRWAMDAITPCYPCTRPLWQGDEGLPR